MSKENTQKSAASFSSYNLQNSILSRLQEMGILSPTKIQSLVIPQVVNSKKDLIAIAETGSGKTLGYLLPCLNFLLVNQQSRSLILVPTREVAQQVHKVIQELIENLEIPVALVIGGANAEKQKNRLNQTPRIIVATPGRLKDHLRLHPNTLEGTKIVVIDEADRMMDMGFAPQLQQILSRIKDRHQSLLFSASFDDKVEGIANQLLTTDKIKIRTESSDAPVTELSQSVVFLTPEQKEDRLLDEINLEKASSIVFCNNKTHCERVFEYLQSYGVNCEIIHGEMSQGHRNRAIRGFRTGEVQVLVSTDLLARGIDVPHVDMVINFDLPLAAEDFLHRIGRTARAGKSGRAVSFFTKFDFRIFQKLSKYLKPSKEIKLDPHFQWNQKPNPTPTTKTATKMAAHGRPLTKPSAKGNKETPRSSHSKPKSSSFKGERAKGPSSGSNNKSQKWGRK